MDKIKKDELAIISMSCRLPDSDTTSELWLNLSQGNSSIKQIPEDRWRLKDFYSAKSVNIGKSNTKRGTFLTDVKGFDPHFFGIYPEDAYLMDPQQRILIELAYELIHSTKYLPEEFVGKKVGVFLGITKADYREFVQEALIRMQLKQNTAVIGVLQNMIAARISHTFDLQGPALTIDTACSSSLVALHLASESIFSGSSEMAIVGGINLNLIPVPYLGMAAAGALSPGENYHVFDQHSDGFFMGEGGGLILIKKLSEAIKDNDNILGVIKGSAINNDGKSMSPMAPRSSTQQMVLNEAYSKSGLSINDVDYIEAHGTGTFLGDAIEAKTLIKVFSGKKNIFLGSIKPNIGHLLSGAGIASIIKVLLSFQYRKIPPLINYQDPRPELGLEESGFIINTSLKDYNLDKPMLSGINGFGFGGTNAHIILEEYQPKKELFTQFVPAYNKSPYWLYIDFSLDTKFSISESGPQTETIFLPEWVEQSKPVNNSALPDNLIAIGSPFYHGFQEKFSDFFKSKIKIISPENLTESLEEKTNLLILFPKSYQYLLKLLQEINENKEKVQSITIITEQSILLPNDLITESTSKFLTSGLIVVASSELVNIPIKHIDLDLDDSEDLKITQITSELSIKSASTSVYRNNKLFKKEFKPFYFKLNNSLQNSSFKSGVYLITGGSSGIGLEIARYISNQAEATIILIGRRQKNEIKQWQKISKEIITTGSTLEYFSIDIAEPEEVDQLFNNIMNKYKVINGIIHAAGVFDASLFEDKTSTSFENTLKSKVNGIKLLTKQVELYNLQLDFFVAFSSISSAIPGFARTISDYAVANYYLDQYCLLQNKKQKPYQVINWGPWSEHGMATGNKFLLEQMSAKGIKPIDTEKGLQILGQIIKQHIPHSIVTNSDIPLENIIANNHTIQITKNKKTKIVENTFNHSHQSLQQLLTDIIKDELPDSKTVKEIGLNDNLLDLGIDSLSAIEIIARLGNAGFKNLPFELIFENQTIKDIVDYLMNNLPAQTLKAVNVLDANVGHSDNSLITNFKYDYSDLSPQQEAFYKAHNITGVPNFSFMRQSIKAKLDLSLLEKSVKLLLEKYPLLRANFFIEKENGDIKFKQKINPLNNYSEEKLVELIELNDSLKAVENKFANSCFNLEKDLLIKITIVEEKDINHLLILAHHIIFDGVSMHLIIRDLWNFYLELNKNNLPEITPSKTHYFDYVTYINKSKNNEKYKKSSKWWENNLKSFTKIENNIIKEIIDFKTENSSSSLFKIPEQHYKNLKKLIENKKVSYQFLLLTIYAKALTKFFDSSNLSINIAVTGRQHQLNDINNIVGCFADTLPIYIDFKDSKIDIINQSQELRNKWNDSKQYHNITSSELLPILKSNNIPAIPFSFSFVAFNKEWTKNLPFEVIESNARGFNSNTRLSIQIWEDLNGLNYTLNYPENLFSDNEITQFSKLFLDNIIKTIEANTSTESSVENIIIKSFLADTYQHPEKAAIIYQDDSENNQKQIVSYQESDKLSNLIAGSIKNRTSKENPAIAVIGSISANTAIALLGILKCGGIYIPVEKDYPFYRIEDMLKISNTEMVILTDDFPDKNKIKNIPVLDFSELIVENHPATDLKPLNTESIAYVIFTSGSTGKPKGVPITYQAIFSYLEWCIKTFEYNAEDRIIQTSSICFDASIRQVLVPLMTGATLYPLSTDTKRDIKALWNFIEKNEITVWSSVPSLWEKFVSYAEKQTDKNLDSLRVIKVGGEVLKPSVVRDWQKMFGLKQKIVNLYGPTETTINASYHTIDYLVDDSITALPIGKSLPYFNCEIRNSDGILLKNNEKGEFYISGIGVTPGYLNDYKALEKFFTDEKGHTFYKTGDLVSKDKNDNYFFHGRTDRQIKIRGFRIELEEIENILLDHPLIIAAVVESLTSKNGIQQLVAFITLRYDFISIKEIREYLAKELPEYIIPNKIEIIKSFPLLTNGKVDRKSLINSFIQNNNEYYLDSAESVISKSENNTEEIVTNIWKKLLNIPSPLPESDFFEAGGDSILLMQLFMDLEEFIPNLPRIADFYKNPKLVNLLDLIANQQRVHSLPEKKLVETFPLSPAQIGFYLSNKYLGGDNSYWTSSFYLQGNINISIWKESLEILQYRHQMLNVKLINENPPYFAYQNQSDLFFEYIELSDNNQINLVPENDNPEFDLEKGYPLIKHKLIKTNVKEYLWNIKAHHILADGLSCLIFGKELIQVYNNLSKNEPITLPNLKNQFSDFSIYMQNQLKNNSYKDNIYWTKIFSIPYKEPNLEIIGENEKGFFHIKENLSLELWSDILQQARENSCTPFIILLTSFYRAISEYLDQNDLIIGVAQNGRDYPIPGIQNIFGCFAQALPIRINNENILTLELVNNLFKESITHSLNPSELLRRITPGTKLKSILGTQFFFSFIDYSGLEKYPENSEFKIDWNKSESVFQTGNNDTAIFLTAKKLNNNVELHFSFNHFNFTKGSGNELVSMVINNLKKPVTNSNKNTKITVNNHPLKISETGKIDALLIGYLPALKSLPVKKTSADKVINQLFDGKKALWFDVIKTELGNSGTILLPLFAEEIVPDNSDKISDFLKEALELANSLNVKNISLAGMLPSVTGFATQDNFTENSYKLTTGHSCTVSAVVKTFQKILETTNINLKESTMTFAGLGSIGKGVLYTLLSLGLHPENIILCDLLTTEKQIQQIEEFIYENFSFKGNLIKLLSKGSLPEEAYNSNIMITAVSKSNVIDIDKLKPGTIIIDDSFPYCFDTAKAIQRMENVSDILITGGGLLKVECFERIIYFPDNNQYISNLLTTAFIADTMASCQFESLLISNDNGLPVTNGLADYQQVKQYIDSLDKRAIKAAPFHIGKYIINQEIILKFNSFIHQVKYRI